MELKEKFYKGDGYIFSIDGKQPITLNALSQGLQNTLGGYNGLDEKPFGRGSCVQQFIVVLRVLIILLHLLLRKILVELIMNG